MADQGISTILGNGFVIRNGKLEVEAGTVGTTSGTVAAGDDPRIVNAVQASALDALLARSVAPPSPTDVLTAVAAMTPAQLAALQALLGAAAPGTGATGGGTTGGSTTNQAGAPLLGPDGAPLVSPIDGAPLVSPGTAAPATTPPLTAPDGSVLTGPDGLILTSPTGA